MISTVSYRLAVVASKFATVAACLLFAASPGSAEQIALSDVRSWGYQLQGHPRAVAKSGFDVLVVDYSSDGSSKCVLSKADVEELRERPGESSRPAERDRIVLAYLSVGEAEDYRFYWDEAWVTRSIAQPPARPDIPCNTPSAEWTAYGKIRDKVKSAPTQKAPAWLSAENPNWRGNFAVRYWDPSWQRVLLGSREAYLDRILAAGFDGVYLDRVDAYEDWHKGRKTAARDMVELVKRIAEYGRARKPGFLVVPQNGEELVIHKDYLASIDGIAKEDLLYGLDRATPSGVPNGTSDVRHSQSRLDIVQNAGKTVLVVEYLNEAGVIETARRRISARGYVPLFARRDLDVKPVATVSR